MKDYLISAYIDDELDMDEKIEFVETVHDNAAYKDESVGLLRQEKLIRADAGVRLPDFKMPRSRVFSFPSLRPAFAFAAGLAAALAVMFIAVPRQEPGHFQGVKAHRFVLYQPDAGQVEITGSFLGWEAVPMRKSGSSGYWETVLEVPAGEHRLCYILEGNRRIPDPTIPLREKDDFGGENSILAVKVET